jgi:hypothetical protein
MAQPPRKGRSNADNTQSKAARAKHSDKHNRLRDKGMSARLANKISGDNKGHSRK